MKQSRWDLSGEIDWLGIGAGETLTKFIAVDEARKDHEGGYTVEVHGLFDEQGRFHITNTIVQPVTENLPIRDLPKGGVK